LVLVIGATGGCGRFMLLNAIKNTEYRWRLLVRDEERALKTFESLGFTNLKENRYIELVKGDVTQSATELTQAFQGVHYIFLATGVGYSFDGGMFKSGLAKKVDYEGTKKVVEAALAAQTVKHIAMVSSLFVLRPQLMISRLLNLLFDGDLDWKLYGENAVRSSGIPYTIIRPGNLDSKYKYPTTFAELNQIDQLPFTPKALQIDQGDRIQGHTSRADVAKLALLAFKFPEQSKNVTLDFITRPEALVNPANFAPRGDVEEDFREAFKGLHKETKSMPNRVLIGDVDKCQICQSTFYFWNTKYPCYNCGQRVCRSCLGGQRQIPEYALLYPVEVCKNCKSS